MDKKLQFLSDREYWMYGPCFEIRFYFREKRCSLDDFENGLFSEPMVSALSPNSLTSSKEEPRRCVLAIGNGEKPLGFIYWGRERGNYDYYHLATYPKQIERHYGRFHWHGNADNPQSVIELYTELIPFIRRLYLRLGFHLAFVSDEGAPWFTIPDSSLTGILIYDWLARQGDFGDSEFIDYCYALLPF